MSAVRIIGELMLAFEPLTSIVPETAIKAWALPQGAGLPSLVANRISRVRVQFLAATQVWMVTERVQVTARSGSGSQREQILKLVERACADQTGMIAGFENVAVLAAGGGPDFNDDAASIFMGSTDFRVSFNEPA